MELEAYKVELAREMDDLKEACEEARLIREGKAKGFSAKDLLNEL